MLPSRDLTRFTIFDGVAIAALLAVPAWALVAAAGAGSRRVVEVQRAGRLVGAYPLEQDRMVNVGADVKVEISRGRVRVAESDCPKGVCRHTGWQSRPGRVIVCLPNRVVVRIVGGEPPYDAESY